MACEKAKTAVQRKRKYTARRAKVDETTKKEQQTRKMLRKQINRVSNMKLQSNLIRE